MEPIDTFEHAGLTVEIVADDELSDIYNPRDGDCNLGTMYVSYRGYELGDEQLPDSGFDPIECPVCEGGERRLEGPIFLRERALRYNGDSEYEEIEPICPRCEGWDEVQPTIDEWLAHNDALCAMPLFVYEHSGITIRTGAFKMIGEPITGADVQSKGRFVSDDAGWDTSFVGFVLTTRERCEELGVEMTPENLERQLDAEVSEYAKYLEGDAGGYVIKDGDEVLDSCWGFLGLWDEHVRESAKEAAEFCREDITKENAERAHWAARDVMTLA